MLSTSVIIHRESVNIKQNDQSDHDTRIWYHGSAASKECLQAPTLSFSPQAATRLASLANFIQEPDLRLRLVQLVELVDG